MKILTLSGLIGGLLTASGLAQAAQPVLVTIDSSGQTVGAMSGEGLVTLKLKPNSDVVQMRVDVDHLGDEGYQYYANGTCAGAIYLKSRSLLRNAYLKQGDPTTIIFADLSATPTATKSVKFASSCYKQADTAYPARQVSVGEQKLTPPFSVKFQ